MSRFEFNTVLVSIVLAFAISAFFVGMAGAVWGEYLTYLRPNIFLIILIAANMVLMCIIGGNIAGKAQATLECG